ncbi:hypothetical protein QYF61_009458 [Mycteria americana]|uniref:Uncharacterized protein n=1 Tax=Mycteria americana TaxID=33587 RepID=A0AAN7N778_MYCAM|nr:hypothetical protein QYF61_009458 [Mycteria americana]
MKCSAKGVKLSSGSVPIKDGSSITVFIRKMLVSSVQITSDLLMPAINSMLYTSAGLRCCHLLGGCREDGASLFSEVHSNRTRGNRHESELGKFHLNYKGKELFYHEVVKHWNRDPEKLWDLHPWRY